MPTRTPTTVEWAKINVAAPISTATIQSALMEPSLYSADAVDSSIRARDVAAAGLNLCCRGYDPPVTGAVKSLWAAVQGDPSFMRRVNGWLTVLWIVMIPVSIATHWISSVTYVAALSLWALVSGHWSAWQAARVEVKQEQEAEERARVDLPGEVVERLVEQTDVDPRPS
jgi:hypothetical protein